MIQKLGNYGKWDKTHKTEHKQTENRKTAKNREIFIKLLTNRKIAQNSA